MNKDVKAKWLARLRDPSIVQGTGRLCTIDSWPDGVERRHEVRHAFCCLGVLAQLAAEAGVIPAPVLDGQGALRYYVYDGSYTHLSRKVTEWAGLGPVSRPVGADDEGGPVVPSGGVTLISLNDAGASFAEIADIIENEY